MLADPNMFGFMVAVRLPDDVLPTDTSTSDSISKQPCIDESSAEKLREILHYDFRIEVHKLYHKIFVLV